MLVLRLVSVNSASLLSIRNRQSALGLSPISEASAHEARTKSGNSGPNPERIGHFGDPGRMRGSTESGGSVSDASSSSSSSAATADSVTLSWSAPTENTNGSALTNLSGYVIYYGTSASAMTQTIDVNTVGILTYVVDNLSAGTWYFQIVAVNAAAFRATPRSQSARASDSALKIVLT